MLRELSLRRITLLTNNPRKIAGLSCHGIDVRDERLLIEPTQESEPYLRTKAEKMGHLLPHLPTRESYRGRRPSCGIERVTLSRHAKPQACSKTEESRALLAQLVRRLR